MRVAALPAIVSCSMLMLSAAPASAQPTLYVCTPTAQVLTVDGMSGALSVLYTHETGGVFHDCVLGPDGRLYIAADAGILRLNPANVTSAETIASGVSARGLAFNVATLYFTADDAMTNTSAVYQLVSQGPGLTDALDFTGASPTQAFAVPFSGRGVVFDYPGNMVLASDAKLQSSAPIPPPATPPLLYSGVTADLIGSGIQPVGVALNTCKQVVYADAQSKRIRRVGQSDLAQFAGKDVPTYLEIAADNTVFAVTNDSSTGAAKIWRVNVPFATDSSGCSTGTLELLADLKPLLSGPDKVLGLASALATGIAVSATNHSRTNTFTATQCTNRTFDFGYHKVILNFADCTAFAAGPAEIQLDALKSTLSEVSFDAPSLAFPTLPIEGMRYSSMGGFPVQYRYTLASGPNPFPTPFQSIFVFETQERVATPGVARAVPDAIGAEYTENVGDDYWDASVDPAGARGNDISKRVVFNAGLAQNCILTFEEPFQTGNPQFKSGQSMRVGVLANDAVTGRPCIGAQLRISISRMVGDQLVVKQVVSVGGAQTDNIMSPAGAGKYVFNVDLTGFAPVLWDLYVWGSVTPPIKRTFNVQ